MMKMVFLVALLLTLHLPTARGEEGDLSHRGNGKFPEDVQDIQEKSQENACDCCQKCKAARRPQPDLQENVGEKNGCEDCCRKCGRPVQPSPEEIPPEIIDKPRSK